MLGRVEGREEEEEEEGCGETWRVRIPLLLLLLVVVRRGRRSSWVEGGWTKRKDSTLSRREAGQRGLLVLGFVWVVCPLPFLPPPPPLLVLLFITPLVRFSSRLWLSGRSTAGIRRAGRGVWLSVCGVGVGVWVVGLGVCVVLQVGFEFVMGACPLRPHPGQEGQAKEPKARHPGLEDNKGRCMHAATEGWVGSAPWTARGGKGLTQGLGTHVGGPMPSNDSSTSWRLATLALILLALSSTHHNAHRALPHPTHPHREAKAIAEARKGYGFLISSAHKERPPRHRHTIRSPTPPHPTHPHRDAKTMAEAEAEAEAEAVEDPLNFSMMTEAIARLWLEEHPEKVNDLDTDGNPLLWVAACGP